MRVKAIIFQYLPKLRTHMKTTEDIYVIDISTEYNEKKMKKKLLVRKLILKKRVWKHN